MQLETERLLLRPLSIEDLDDFAPLYSDPEVMRYLGAGRTLSREGDGAEPEPDAAQLRC